MAFLKFWGKKSKAKDDLEVRKEEDPEAEKRRLRHSLSISRSGRFKQRKRERSGILDRPELYNTEGDPDFTPSHSAAGSDTSSAASTTSTASTNSEVSSSSSSNRTPTLASRSNRPALNQQTFSQPVATNRRSGQSMQAT